MAEGPIIGNSKGITGDVGPEGNNKAYDNEHGKRSVPNTIDGDPVNNRSGNIYGGSGGVDAR